MFEQKETMRLFPWHSSDSLEGHTLKVSEQAIINNYESKLLAHKYLQKWGDQVGSWGDRGEVGPFRRASIAGHMLLFGLEGRGLKVEMMRSDDVRSRVKDRSWVTCSKLGHFEKLVIFRVPKALSS